MFSGGGGGEGRRGGKCSPLLPKPSLSVNSAAYLYNIYSRAAVVRGKGNCPIQLVAELIQLLQGY